jgi:hypothetical protein
VKTNSLLAIAAAVAAMTIVGVAVALVPEAIASPPVIVALIVLALAVAFIFYAPGLALTGMRRGDAAPLSLIGPYGALSILILCGAAAAFVLAILGLHRFAKVIDILVIGGAIVSIVVLRIVYRVVDESSTKSSGPSRHSSWHAELDLLATAARDPATRTALERLAEKARFAASDAPGMVPDSSGLEAAVTDLSALSKAGAQEALTMKIEQIEALLARRELDLRAMRNRA